MRFLFFITALVFSNFSTAQPNWDDCKPNVNLKVKFCYYSRVPDSTCTICKECLPTLIPLNDGLTIESFVLRSWGPPHDGDIVEAPVTGSSFKPNSSAMYVLRVAQKGTFLHFFCIKAKTSTGKTYILQDLLIEIK
jgi:hypothetical protein